MKEEDNRAFLTRDNLHLSRPTNSVFVPSPFAGMQAASIECHDADVEQYVRHSLSPNTQRAYLADLAHFQKCGGRVPASPNDVASYVAAHAEVLSIATLVRRLATISKAHAVGDLPNPCRTEIVRATLRGIKRMRGSAQRQAKPLLREELSLVIDGLGDGAKDVRDRALLLLGFAGGFRRSELVGLDWADVERVRQGLIATLKFSKTDQEGAGRKIGIPYGRTRCCPVTALDAWLALARIEIGPLFRPLDRHGHIQAGRLSGEAVSLVVRQRVAAAGIDPSGFSGHSLRAGFVTSATRAGVPFHKISAQTGHASYAMLSRYIRDGQLFSDNAAAALL